MLPSHILLENRHRDKGHNGTETHTRLAIFSAGHVDSLALVERRKCVCVCACGSRVEYERKEIASSKINMRKGLEKRER